MSKRKGRKERREREGGGGGGGGEEKEEMEWRVSNRLHFSTNSDA